MIKDIDYYLSLPSKIVLRPSPEGGYGISIPELPGCISQGETLEEAFNMIEDAKRCWIACALEEGEEVPEPEQLESENFSGKYVVRIPKSLHRDLARKAKEENVSLNQLTTYLLSAGISRQPLKK